MRATITEAEYRAWLDARAAELRFGTRDRFGSANLIDDAARARALGAVREARPISLARPMTQGVSSRGDGKPQVHLEVFHTPSSDGRGFSSDHVELDCHGFYNTHLDGLNHVAVDDSYYSGWPVDTLGAASPSVADFAGGLVARAVYLNVAGVRGVEYIGMDDEPVGADDLDHAVRDGGITLARGDALCLDLGRDRFEAAGFQWRRIDDVRPGVGVSGAMWIASHEISLLCWDMLDAEHPSEPTPIPVHRLMWAIGLLLVDNCRMTELRESMDGRSGVAGAVVVAPLKLAGATGCNVNPLVLR